MRDKRYKVVKNLIQSGEIKTFLEIFDYLPKTVLTLDLGTNNTRMKKLLNNPDLFTLRELSTIAGFIEIDPMILVRLALSQPSKKKR